MNGCCKHVNSHTGLECENNAEISACTNPSGCRSKLSHMTLRLSDKHYLSAAGKTVGSVFFFAGLFLNEKQLEENYRTVVCKC